MSNSIPKVPPEIADVIIDQFHNDPQGLAVCALVCRTWLPSSRFHLFRTVKLRPIRLPTFVALLTSPRATFVTHIRHVEIASTTLSAIDKRIPHPTCFAAVSSLQLRFSVWGPGYNLSTTFVSAFRSITRLEMERVAFQHSTILIDILSGFPLLERISLEIILLGSNEPAYSGEQRIASSLRALALYSDDQQIGIFSWLCLHNPLPAIHTLELRDIVLLDLVPVGNLIRNLGDSLHHLTISFTFNWADPIVFSDLCHEVDLSHNRGLRYLHFSDIMLLGITQPGFNEWIPPFLAQVTSHVEELKFTIAAKSVDDFGDLDWDHLDQVLGQAQFMNLRDVLFDIRYYARPEEVTEYIEANLPICDARGILRFIIPDSRGG